MKKRLTFHQITFDMQRLTPTTFPGALSFFTGDLDASETAASVRDAPEDAVMRWLLAHPAARNLICSNMHIPDTAVHRLCVTKPVLERQNAKPGDVDWLCADRDLPNLAVAAECKRVKIVACRDGIDRYNRIDALSRGVEQVNALAGLGIHQTFFVILLVADGRDRTENNHLFRGASDSTFQQVYNFTDREKLAPDVGLVFIEIVQPSARSIDRMGSVGVCVEQQALRREQTASMTSRIRALLSQSP